MPLDVAGGRGELWRPLLRAGQRQKLEAIHQGLAVAWRRAVLEQFGVPLHVSFDGLRMERFASLIDAQTGPVFALGFKFASAAAHGLISFDGALVRAWTETQLGGRTGAGAEPAAELTPVELAIGRQIASALVGHLASACVSGLGQLSETGRAQQLRELHGFDAGDHLLVARFTFEGENFSGTALVALNTAVTGSLARGQSSRSTWKRREPRPQVLALPLAAELTLGSLALSLDDLLALKIGSSMALPQPDEAELVVGGKSIARLEVRFEPNQTVARVLRGPRALSGPP